MVTAIDNCTAKSKAKKSKQKTEMMIIYQFAL